MHQVPTTARRFAQAGVGALALLVWQAGPAPAAPGQLDPSFGAGGTVVSQFPDSYSGARAVALLPGGGIVAAGFAHGNDSIVNDFAVARYSASGALDPGFGAGGLVRTDFGGRYDEALAVAVQPDGKIVVAGSSSDSTGADMAVARYNGDGTLDPTFDGDGTALVDLGGDSSARAIAVQADGKLVLAGRSTRSDGGVCCSSEFTLVRLSASGSPDGTFGDGGHVSTSFSSSATDRGSGTASAVLVQPDGLLVAAGGASFAGGGNGDFAVARYRADGSLDPTFSGDGRQVTDFAGYFDEARALSLDARGGVVAGGTACDFPGSADEACDYGVARYTGKGALDSHFGRGGRVRTDLGGDVNEGIRGLVVQADGRIAVAGETRGDVGLVRYRSGGQLDRGFGTRGVVITAVSPSTDEVGGLGLRADGRLVVAGTAAIAPASFGFFVSRYLGS